MQHLAIRSLQRMCRGKNLRNATPPLYHLPHQLTQNLAPTITRPCVDQTRQITAKTKQRKVLILNSFSYD
jgi:hypothetical protein